MACLDFLITALLITVSTAQNYRLPTVYSPSNYAINLVLPSDIFTTENATEYTGSVAVTFTVSENVGQVILHASATYVDVTSVSLTSGTTEYNVTDYSVNNTTDILTITLETTLTVNLTFVLNLNFVGQLSITNMYGLYKSSYTDSSNITYYLATTQFAPTYARRAFPCFDEPSYKATFSISLTYPSELNVLANTDVNTTTTNATNSLATTVFNPTPKMSTYLVAFIVSSYTCSQGNLIEGSIVNQVCSRNETSSTRSWALEVAPLAIDSLNSYLSINYSVNMAKLDQVAIPDFSFGAMENWGLVTYRERALLYDDNETSNANKQYIASVIVHELSHQWFGNLVTCKWWSEIFLNEGFATFFQYFISNELLPEYEMDKQFVIKILQYIFETDASATEALRKDASTPSEIFARFGGITYQKGASVLRMVEHILGTAAWKIGLNTYLEQFAYSSAEPDDLWTVLNATTALDLPAANLALVMANWINYPGYPVVTVSLTDNVLKISQKRFVYSNTTSSNVTWYVPITYITSQNTSTINQTTPMIWLTPDADFEETLDANLSWIVLNNQQTGYFRVNYDINLWSGLTTALQETSFSGIPEINRAQIVNDAFSLARGGYLNYTQTLNIIQFLSNETSYTVWYPCFSGFEYVLRRVGENSTLGRAISSHVLALSSSLILSAPLTSVNESDHIYTLNQVQAQSWACKLGDSTCITTAIQLFASYKNTSVRPNKNLRSIVYSYGLKHSTDISADWAFLWDAYLSTSLSTEQVTILSALGCTNNETILIAYLQKTLTDNSGIRSQDYAAVFAAVYTGSSVGVDVALDFFINNYEPITSRYTSLSAVGNILQAIAEQITTDSQIIKLQNLISSNVLSGVVLEAANAALTSAQNNYEWLNTYKSDLYAYYGLKEETTLAPTTNEITLAPTTEKTTLVPTIPETTTTTSACTTCSDYKSYMILGLMVLGTLIIKF